MQVLSRAELELLLVPVDREAAAGSRNNATISAKEAVGDFSNISGAVEGLKVTIDPAKAEPSSRAVLETLRLLVQVRALPLIILFKNVDYPMFWLFVLGSMECHAIKDGAL